MAHSLAEIAEQFSMKYEGNGELEIAGLCGLSDNFKNHLSFVADRRLLGAASSSEIPAFITFLDCPVEGKVNLFHENPDYAMAMIANLYLQSASSSAQRIDQSAVIADSATIASSATIGANVVIGANAVIGERTNIMAGSILLDQVVIGNDCVIYPNCVLRERSILHDRVVLQPGVVIGGDGFGYIRYGQGQVKIPQLGNVVIESDVEVGANSTIDRARFSSTRIGRWTKIDNGVVVAHNVQIGERCILVAQSGVAGSSRLGNDVVLAGQVGLVGHIHIADNVTLLGQSMATKDIREAGVWAGSPARPAKQWKRAIARLYSRVNRE
ncbi:MAG: UDP-3-O-[3-hydroxymyristoyl] glucosamine N-acyltransferase [Gammaproteobacteria bacterium]|jgi:UDP-3-O-[3-hydroxymyristoyl] glucosamine N-acyltransferase